MTTRTWILAPALAGLFALSSRAASPEAARAPGYIDGSAIAELAGEEGELVEIQLGPSLLNALAGKGTAKPGQESIFRQLRSIEAYIVGLENDTSRETRAEKAIQQLEAKLTSGGWERLARVREKGERVAIFVRNAESHIDGLTVLVFDREQSEVVFVNIAGTIDLAKLGEIGDELDLPGLEDIDVNVKSGSGKGSKTSSKGSSSKVSAKSDDPFGDEE